MRLGNLYVKPLYLYGVYAAMLCYGMRLKYNAQNNSLSPYICNKKRRFFVAVAIYSTQHRKCAHLAFAPQIQTTIHTHIHANSKQQTFVDVIIILLLRKTIIYVDCTSALGGVTTVYCVESACARQEVRRAAQHKAIQGQLRCYIYIPIWRWVEV